MMGVTMMTMTMMMMDITQHDPKYIENYSIVSFIIQSFSHELRLNIFDYLLGPLLLTWINFTQ